jgi:hypothetical protein
MKNDMLAWWVLLESRARDAAAEAEEEDAGVTPAEVKAEERSAQPEANVTVTEQCNIC